MEVRKLIKSYSQWLEESSILEKRKGCWHELNAPLYDNANDCIQIYVRIEGDDVIFTDGAYTLNSLIAQGMSMSSSRKALIENILRQYGTRLSGYELTAKATRSNFALKKHMFIQSILRLDDMAVLSKENVASTFADGVRQFLDKREIYYTRDVQMEGRAGYTHSYDLLFQRSKTKAERLCRVLNSPGASLVASTLFSWKDTKENRDKSSQLIVILNDSRKGMATEAGNALLEYNATVIFWSEINAEENIDMLT